MVTDICNNVCDLCPGELVGRFSWPDILLFAGILIIAGAFKLFFTIRNYQAKEETRVIEIGRHTEIISTVVSLCVNYLSAITILGTSAEIYNVNTSFWIATVAVIPTVAIINHLLLPVVNNLRLTTIYEYLEFRFSRHVRVLACFVFLLNMLLVFCVVLYSLALVLSTVNGRSIELSIGVCGIICFCFTAINIGGQGSKLWTDILLTVIMIAALATVSVIGGQRLGGLGRVWQVAQDHGRIDFLNWNPDPTVRHSVWSLLIGSCVCQLTIFSAYQTLTHRRDEINNLKTTQIALYSSIPPLFLLSTLICLLGLIIFAAYHDCDPLLLGHVKVRDQLFQFLLMDILTPLPGLLGLFTAGILTASLSSISSGINYLSIVFLEDVVKSIWEVRSFNPSSNFISRSSKVIALAVAVCVLALAYVARYLKQTVLQMVLTIFGICCGPLLGLFISGMFIPFINEWGALAGLVVSTGLGFWAGLGETLSLPIPLPNNVSINACADWESVLRNCSLSDDDVASFVDATSLQSSVSSSKPDELWIYQMCYLWFAIYTVIISIITAVVVTFISSVRAGFNKPDDVGREYIHSCCDRMCCYLPLSCAIVDREVKKEQDEINIYDSDWILKDTGHVPPWEVKDNDEASDSDVTELSEHVTSYDISCRDETGTLNEEMEDPVIKPTESVVRNGKIVKYEIMSYDNDMKPIQERLIKEVKVRLSQSMPHDYPEDTTSF